MKDLVRSIGLMSGTSMDGIDVAVIETDGTRVAARGPSMTFPYDSRMRDLLAQAIVQARDIRERRQRPGVLGDVERTLTEQHAHAVSAFLTRHGIARETIEVMGFHGQTVLHNSEAGLTVQLGDGPLLAELTQVPVVYDLRARDMELGGQGAPLVPVYHRAMLDGIGPRPVALVNVGGVANVTWINAEGELVAFDTGPGNALIDDWMATHGGRTYDEDGALAAAGRIDDEVVRSFCDHAYFAAPAPKSLDRNAFSLDAMAGMRVEDGAATLTAITAETIARSQAHMPETPRLWIISGGGRKNSTLMRMLSDRVAAKVVKAEAAGFDGDSIEAEAWAFLAVRSLRGLPITFPGTTGIQAPECGGVYAGPSGRSPRPSP